MAGPGAGVKLRVGAKELQEIGERAFETDILDNHFHLGADAGDFLQPDLVNIPGA